MISLQANGTSRISDDQRQLFLSTLWWSAMNTRENAIGSPSPETVDWIFDGEGNSSYGFKNLMSIDCKSPSTDTANSLQEEINGRKHNKCLFRLWLESNESLFWIRGKAGCGKSTLMKFLSHNQRTEKHLGKWKPSVVILRFFFIQITTDPLQRRLDGCLRSLFYQLLDSDHIVLSKAFESQSLWTNKKSEHDWSTEELQRALINAFQTSDHFFCLFIDGLDEVQKKDQGSAVRLMEILADVSNVKICVSSRE